MDRLCLECNNLLKGRTDKKFCDDQCRSNHNYRLKAQDQGVVNTVNQILKRNRKILQAKVPGRKIRVKRDELLINGFDFHFHTHTYQNRQGEIYFFCYEYGYLMLSGGDILLVKQEGK